MLHPSLSALVSDGSLCRPPFELHPSSVSWTHLYEFSSKAFQRALGHLRCKDPKRVAPWRPLKTMQNRLASQMVVPSSHNLLKWAHPFWDGGYLADGVAFKIHTGHASTLPRGKRIRGRRRRPASLRLALYNVVSGLEEALRCELPDQKRSRSKDPSVASQAADPVEKEAS